MVIAGRVQLGEQDPVQPFEDPGLLPSSTARGVWTTLTDQDAPDLESLLESATEGDAEWTMRNFPSGAVSIDIRFEGRMAAVDEVPSLGEWGVSIDVPESDSFTGHDHVFPTAEEALRFAWSKLSHPQ